MEMQDEFEEGCCPRNQLVILWFETVKLVSAVAMPDDSGSSTTHLVQRRPIGRARLVRSRFYPDESRYLLSQLERRG